MVLQVKRLSEEAKLPTRGSDHAAGYDLYSNQDLKLESGEWAVVKTGISIAVPYGTYGRVAPRSGLTVKHGLDVGAGVIDYDYRGEVGVVLFNHSDEDYQINQGDRIAQLVLEVICTPPVKEVDELTETDRGGGGFGSTGK